MGNETFDRRGFARRLRQTRGERGMRELARAMEAYDPTTPGANHDSVRLYEQDHRQPSAHWIATFCAVTGVTPEWLLWGKE